MQCPCGQSSRSGPTSCPAGCCHCQGPASEACTQETPRHAWQWAGACLSSHVGRHPLSTECESCLKVPLDFSQILSRREWAEIPSLPTLPPHLTAAVAPGRLPRIPCAPGEGLWSGRWVSLPARCSGGGQCVGGRARGGCQQNF